MHLNEYIDEVAVLPLPTEEQIGNFIKHVLGAHSWYKHLPLLNGAKFVFFLASDVGGGYTKENPRLHYSWKTKDEYISRFGYLDYQYQRSINGPFNRDFGGRVIEDRNGYSLERLTREFVDLPIEIINLSSTTLYPYASNQDNAVDAITWRVHESSINDILNGSDHPDQELVIEWYKLASNCKFIPDSDEELQMLKDCSYDREVWRGLTSYKAWKQKKDKLWKTYKKLLSIQEQHISTSLSTYIEWASGVKANLTN